MPANAPVNGNAGPNSTALLDYLFAQAAAGKHLTGANTGFNDTQGGTADGPAGQSLPLGGEFWQYRKITGGKWPAVASLNIQAAGGTATDPPMPLTYDPWGVLQPAFGPYSPAAWGQVITDALIDHGLRGGIVAITAAMLVNPTAYTNNTTRGGSGTPSITTINGSGTPAAPTGTLVVASTGPFSLSGGLFIGHFVNSSGNVVLHLGIYSGLGGSTLTGVWIMPIGFTPGAHSTVIAGSSLAASTIPLANVPLGVTSGTLTVYNDAGALQTITFTGVNMATSSLTGCSGGTGTVSTGLPATILSSWSIEAAFQGAGTDTIAVGAGVFTPHLGPSAASLSAGSISRADPLQWSSTSYLTTGLGTAAAYPALGPNANAALNTMAFHIGQGIYALQKQGIPVIVRLLPEQNNGAGGWWAFSSPRSCTFYSNIWKYLIGFWTGTKGFAGQPTMQSWSGVPLLTEVLFESCQVGVNTWLRVGTSPGGCPIDPSTSAILCDTVGPDYYSATSGALNTVSGDLNTDYPNVPKSVPEFYGNGAGSPAPQAPFPGPSVDLSTAAFLEVLTANISNGPFVAGAGHQITVQTTNGPFSVNLTATSTSGPDTVLTISVSGVPAGSMVIVGSSVVGSDATAVSGATMAGWLNLLGRVCRFATWDTQRAGTSSLGLIGQPGAGGLFTDANSVNLEDISPPLPWANAGLMVAVAA